MSLKVKGKPQTSREKLLSLVTVAPTTLQKRETLRSSVNGDAYVRFGCDDTCRRCTVYARMRSIGE